jgi:hypothetical protein
MTGGVLALHPAVVAGYVCFVMNIILTCCIYTKTFYTDSVFCLVLNSVANK